MSLLYWGAKHWSQNSTLCLTSTEQRWRIPSLNLLAAHCPVQPRSLVAFLVTRAHCWLIFMLFPETFLLSEFLLYERCLIFSTDYMNFMNLRVISYQWKFLSLVKHSHNHLVWPSKEPFKPFFSVAWQKLGVFVKKKKKLQKRADGLTTNKSSKISYIKKLKIHLI